MTSADGSKRVKSGHIAKDGAIRYSKGKQSEDVKKCKDIKKGETTPAKNTAAPTKSIKK